MVVVHRLAAAQHQLPELRGHDHGQPGADADQPLGSGQLDGVEDALQEAELGGEDDRATDSSDVIRNVRSLNVSRLKTDRSSSRAVNEKNRFAIANVVMPIVRASPSPSAFSAPAITPSVATAMTRPATMNQRVSARVSIGCFGLARAALHDPWARRAVAQPDRLEDLRGEVHPQRLHRQERDPAGDVEDARAEERHDHPGQHAHLEADVLDEVVVEPAAELDGLDDRREVVVGEDHRRGLLGDLGAGDAHRDADVGALERRRVVDAVAGHPDDVPLALEDVDEADLLLGRHARDHADLVDLGGGLLLVELGELRAGDRAALDARARARSPPR